MWEGILTLIKMFYNAETSTDSVWWAKLYRIKTELELRAALMNKLLVYVVAN